MNLPKQKNLDTVHLQRLFDNMSECYKLFWFQAIVEQVYAGKRSILYNDLINCMIADAWYMVSEYRLNLGPDDKLEELVHYAKQLLGLKSNEKKDVVIESVNGSNDKKLLQYKQKLTYNVPYRLQAPFLHNLKGNAWDGAKSDLATRINRYEGLIYRFDTISGLNSVVTIDDLWAQYICSNYEIIMGWIQYNMIQYLQRRNPSVPGIPNKLMPPQERQLEKVKKYWRAILSIEPMHEIYAGIMLDGSSISIDHFVPWSYVAHDELWNLHPTTKSINSSKSNHLPDWDTYFSRLCNMEYHAYHLMWSNEQIHTEFDKCAKEHVNSLDVLHKLYQPGLTSDAFSCQLKDIILPAYKAALNLGFDRWKL